MIYSISNRYKFRTKLLRSSTMTYTIHNLRRLIIRRRRYSMLFYKCGSDNGYLIRRWQIAARDKSTSKGDPPRTQQCTFYDIVQGAKQVEQGSRHSYMIKVPKGSSGVYAKTHLSKWVVNLIIVADVGILVLVLGGMGYYMIWKRRKN
ncbi:hypothetical protein AKJ16_DCAP16798 [Drosera capensis]